MSAQSPSSDRIEWSSADALPSPATAWRARDGRAGSGALAAAALATLTCLASGAALATTGLTFHEFFHAAVTGSQIPAAADSAVRVGPGFAQFEYPTAGVIDAAEGTIELWVMPVDWDARDGKFHVFLDARGSGALFLYKDAGDARVLVVATQDANAGPYYSDAVPVDWKPREWHHLAATWSADGVRLYFDGVPPGAAAAEARLPGSFGTHFSVGDLPWSSTRASSSLIRDLRIYNRALSAREIALHYRGEFDPRLTLDPAGTALSYHVQGPDGVCRVMLRSDASSGLEGTTVRFELRSANAVLTSAAAPFDERGRARTSLMLPMRSPGTYRLQASVDRGGRTVLQRQLPLEIPDLTTRTVNDSPTLQPPWSPIRVDDGVIEVWGRRYVFGDSYLPQQITSGGVDLLAGPMTLEAESGGRPLTLRVRRRSLQSAANGEVVAIHSQLAAAEETPALDVAALVSYDGLIEITLAADTAGAGSDAPYTIALRVPLRPDQVRYLYRSDGQNQGLAEPMPERAGVIDSQHFVPWYWLGNDNSGLFWYAESASQWPAFSRAGAIQVVRTPDSVELLLTFLHDQPVPPTWHLKLGLQATPVRPMRADWRTWRLLPSKAANLEVLWPTPTADSTVYYGYPRATDAQQLAARLAASRKAGVRTVPYVCVTCISTAAPEWKFRATDWSNGNYDATSADVRAFGPPLAFVAPAAPGWRDFIVSRTGEFVRRFSFAGLYLDNIRPYGAYAPEAGLGFRNAAGAWRDYPIGGYRELLRAVRAQLLRSDANAVVIAHSSSEVIPPMLAFADAYVDGEQFRGKVKDDYLGVVSIEQFRAEFMGRQWGVAPVFLPEFPAEMAERTAPTRELMALLLVHDVAIWPLNCNLAEVERALAPLRRFGYQDSHFLPYFSAQRPARVVPPGLSVSAYESERGALLIIANLTHGAHGGQICIDPRLSPAGRGVLSDGRKLQIDRAGCFGTTVPAMDYQLLQVQRLSRARS